MRSYRTTALGRAAAIGLSIGLLGLAGCGQQDQQTGGDDQTSAIQDSSAAESGTAQTLNAATQALVDHATVSTPGDQPMALPVRAGETGYMQRLDLPSTASVDLTVHLEDITDAGGNRKYPNLSGTLVIHADGDVVGSWPTGSDVMAHHTVSVTFDTVAYHDPACGATATVISGTYTYHLDSTYHYDAPENWTAAFDAELSVPSTTPLVWTIARPSAATHAVSVFGVRDGHLRFARTNDTGSGGSTNRLVVDAQIDGTHGDPATSSTIDGVTGIDPAATGDSYTDWEFAIDGSTNLVWNRRAIVHVQWDFAPSLTLHLSGSDRVYITRDGTKNGPYTADQLKSRFHCTLDD